ncbi:hypothetical protein SH661x_003987 [Planctomicrobium sp. SH661]|uniref:hypothetical protein n=1 Tax=Planctomicrobium sp. SH661 TaxID=3448124 RepID=UPI003F5C608E
MSSIPFRTAFWALGLAFTMTVMLLVPNPQKIRMALHARRNAVKFPYEQTLVTSLDAPTEEAPAEDAPAEEVSDARIDLSPVMESAPVRVASADPSASIGLGESTTAAAAPASPSPVATQEPEAAEAAPLDIPVPDPVHRVAAAPMPAPETVEAPLPITRTTEPTPAPPPFPGEVAAVITPVPVPAEPEIVSEDSTISITSGTHPKRWNIRFERTDLESALKLLARYQGCTVILDPELHGEYTGQFLDADPAQAFAILVKTYDCKVSRRGNILMLARRTQDNFR